MFSILNQRNVSHDGEEEEDDDDERARTQADHAMMIRILEDGSKMGP